VPTRDLVHPADGGCYRGSPAPAPLWHIPIVAKRPKRRRDPMQLTKLIGDIAA